MNYRMIAFAIGRILLTEAALVITGEGRIDSQSACGKVVGCVASHCARRGVPCVALCGSIGTGAEELYQHGLTAMFSSICGFADQNSIQETCREDMQRLCRAVARLMGRH